MKEQNNRNNTNGDSVNDEKEWKRLLNEEGENRSMLLSGKPAGGPVLSAAPAAPPIATPTAALTAAVPSAAPTAARAVATAALSAVPSTTQYANPKSPTKRTHHGKESEVAGVVVTSSLAKIRTAMVPLDRVVDNIAL